MNEIIKKVYAESTESTCEPGDTPMEKTEPDVEDIIKAVFSDSDSDSNSEQEEDSAITKEEYYNILCTQNEEIRRINSRDETEEDNMNTTSNTDLIVDLTSSDTQVEDCSTSISHNKKVGKMSTSHTIIEMERIDMSGQNWRSHEQEEVTLATGSHFDLKKKESIECLDVVDLQSSTNSETGKQSPVRDNSQQEKLDEDLGKEECGNADLSFTSNFSLEANNDLSLHENALNISITNVHSIAGGNETDDYGELSNSFPDLNIEETEPALKEQECRSYSEKSQHVECNLPMLQNYKDTLDDEVILIESPVHSVRPDMFVAPLPNRSAVRNVRMDSSCSDLFDSPISSTSFNDSRHHENKSKRQLSDSFSTPLSIPSSKRLKISTPMVSDISGEVKKRLSGLTMGHESMLLSPVENTNERKIPSLLRTSNNVARESFETEVELQPDASRYSSNSDDDLRITGDNFAELTARSSSSAALSDYVENPSKESTNMEHSDHCVNKGEQPSIPNTVNKEINSHQASAERIEENLVHRSQPDDRNNGSENGEREFLYFNC